MKKDQINRYFQDLQIKGVITLKNPENMEISFAEMFECGEYALDEIFEHTPQ